MLKGCDGVRLDFKAIGKRIKIARIRADLTQETVAETVGVTAQHVSNIETGSSRVSLTTLVNIANLLGVSLDELLCDAVLAAQPIFLKEVDDIFRDCSECEIRVLADILKAAKESMRNVKMFEAGMSGIGQH